MTPTEDRRRRRSNDPLVALHYQLTQTRQDAHLDAIVVADPSGFVVAGAGAWPICEELAAYAPLLAQRGVWSEPEIEGGSRMAELKPEIDVRAVDIEAQSVLLCARGGWMRAKAIEQAASGVARILGAR